MAAAESDRFQRHDHSDDTRFERIAKPAAVREDQIALQVEQPVVGDTGLGEEAEAGIDAVDGLAAGDDPASGVMRHADAGYEAALACAREQGLDLPMVGR